MLEGIHSTGFQMSLLLFFALSGYMLGAILKQSAVIGHIIIGVLIGPSVLGLMSYEGLIVEAAHLGAVILLFVVGLEFKVSELFQIKSGLIALFGVVVPWISGYCVAKLFGYNFISALFVGTALTATSIAITANVLHELGFLHTELSNTIIGAAVIDDILALLALTISTQVAQNIIDVATLSFFVIKALIFIAFGILFGNFVIRGVISRIDRLPIASKYPEFIFVLAMSFAFLYAMLSELFGLSDIIGAFIAGVALEGITLRNSKSFQEGADYLRILFASIFFVSLGVLANLSYVTTTVIGFSIVISIVAILTKLIGCGVMAKLWGCSNKRSLIIGIGMSPRGEVAMVIALLALKEKIINQDIYVSLIMMSLITTIVAPIALRYLLKGEKPETKESYKVI